MIPRHSKTHKTALKFILIPEAMFVKIIEGFRAFLFPFTWGGNPVLRGSVQSSSITGMVPVSADISI